MRSSWLATEHVDRVRVRAWDCREGGREVVEERRQHGAAVWRIERAIPELYD